MARVTAEQLTTPHGAEMEEVPIPHLGGDVLVRGLRRSEALRAQGAEGVGAVEQRMVSMAMVDPPMTVEQVKAWQESSDAGELEPVTRVIQRLSGMEDGADKAAYKSVADDARSGV